MKVHETNVPSGHNPVPIRTPKVSDLISVPTAADRLGIKRQNAHRLVANGSLHHCTIDGNIFVSAAQVNTMADERMQAATQRLTTMISARKGNWS